MYVKFAEHLRTKPNCRSSGQKMLEMLDGVIKTPGGERKLSDFLKKSFPHVLINKGVQQIPPWATPMQVFSHYDPSLLTIPRKTAIRRDQGHNLENVIDGFIADKAIVEWIIVDDVAYIEWLPRELAGVASSIPESNWEIRQWKKQHKS